MQNWRTSLKRLYKLAKGRYDAIPDSNSFHGHNLEVLRTIESYQQFEPKQLHTLIRETEEVLRDITWVELYSGMKLDVIARIKRGEFILIKIARCFFVSKSKILFGVQYVPIHSLLMGIVGKHLAQNYGEYLLAQSNNIIRKNSKRGLLYR